MSKLETPMIRRYWQMVGGTLCEEFQAVARSGTAGQRLIDGVILPSGPLQQLHWRDISLQDQDVIIVQAKASRLGMYLMGQAFFSADLIRRFRPRSITSVALCTQDDEILRPIFEAHPGMRVEIMPHE